MAIAFNAATDGGNNGGSTNSLTFAHTCGAGADRLLVVGVAGDSAGGFDDITGVTYNGVAMTLAKKELADSASSTTRHAYQYFLVAPATGANNVVVSCTNNHYLLCGAADYTGMKQSGQPDATTSQETAVSALTQTTSITPIAASSWAALMEGGYSGGGDIPPTAGAGCTRRAKDGTFGTWGIFDTNAEISAAHNMTTDRPDYGSKGIYSILHAIASYAPVPTTPEVSMRLNNLRPRIFAPGLAR